MKSFLKMMKYNINKIPEVQGMNERTKRIIRVSGYAILAVSCLLFIMIPATPLLRLDTARTAAISAGLLIAGEITFWISMLILGKSFYEKLKGWFRFRKTRPESEQKNSIGSGE